MLSVKFLECIILLATSMILLPFKVQGLLWSEGIPKKSVNLSIKAKGMTKYKIADTEIITNTIHKDLNIIRPVLGPALQKYNC